MAHAARRLPALTVHRWFARLRDEGVLEGSNHLVMLDRERTGRDASPRAALIDTQSVKTTESGGPRGYDAGKKVVHGQDADQPGEMVRALHDKEPGIARTTLCRMLRSPAVA